MQEKDFSIIFRHWLRANPQITCSFEIKDTLGKDSLPFSAVKEAQINYALAIQSDKGTLIRVQAVSEGYPDFVYLRNTPAHIVIKYPKAFCIIPINNFLYEKEKSKRKSLTFERAKIISINL